MKYYTEEHEWVEVTDDEATIGISEYAAEQLGEVSYVELPEEDDCFNIGDRLGEIESEKTSCDIYSPISGTVCAVNDTLADAPDLLNESPEDKGWICKMIDFDPADLDDLMDEEAYMEYVESLN
ncbi:MAG: glycine cleavage system protein GcvH [Lentisphaeria bacterium]|nr:glycine cleavage system protein GcvH [Lentisphaeria bacterium]